MPKKRALVLYILLALMFVYFFKNDESEPGKQKPTPVINNISEIEYEFNYDYDNLLSKYNLNKSTFFGFPYVSSIFHTRHIFQSLSNFVQAMYQHNLKAENIKCGDIVFIKTDYIKLFFQFYYPKIKYPFILITHESAHAIGYDWQINYLKDPKIIAWFGQNVIARHFKLKPLPLGIVPPENEKFSTIYKFSQNLTPYYSRSLLLYTNISPHTNENRTDFLNFFKTKYRTNTNVFIDELRISWKKYLLNLGSAQFVLSPPGMGTDCHRTWEALIMGAVPIVIKSELQPLYDNMPVMVINEWADVTEENLKRFQIQRMQNFSKDGIPWRPKIWLRYWINEIKGFQRNYVNSYC